MVPVRGLALRATSPWGGKSIAGGSRSRVPGLARRYAFVSFALLDIINRARSGTNYTLAYCTYCQHKILVLALVLEYAYILYYLYYELVASSILFVDVPAISPLESQRCNDVDQLTGKNLTRSPHLLTCCHLPEVKPTTISKRKAGLVRHSSSVPFVTALYTIRIRLFLSS